MKFNKGDKVIVVSDEGDIVRDVPDLIGTIGTFYDHFDEILGAVVFDEEFFIGMKPEIRYKYFNNLDDTLERECARYFFVEEIELYVVKKNSNRFYGGRGNV